MRIACLTTLVAAWLSLAGCAASHGAAKPDDIAMVPAPAQQADPACSNETGSRVASSSAHCSGFGRSYSSDDINRTGSSTAAGALRLLDPSLTVH